MHRYLSVLKNVVLFAGIRGQDVLSMLECLRARVKLYKKEEYVWLAGDHGAKLGVLLSGQLQILREDLHGNRTIVAQVQAGDIFGEAFACAEVTSVPVSVLAMSDCAVLILDHQRMIKTCGSACAFHARLIANMLRLLAQKNILLTQKNNYLAQRTTREKLLTYLVDEATKAGSNQFHIPFNRQELADYLCVERSAMSAELSRLRASGLLDYQKNEFTFLREYTK